MPKNSETKLNKKTAYTTDRDRNLNIFKSYKFRKLKILNS